MTETARDIALAILALDEVVTALRALSDDLNEPDPAWPTAPLVWWGGKVWVSGVNGVYQTAGDYWAKGHLDGVSASFREASRRFAREAVPVTPVPTEAWEKWESWVPSEAGGTFVHDRALIEAVDSLAQEVAR